MSNAKTGDAKTNVSLASDFEISLRPSLAQQAKICRQAYGTSNHYHLPRMHRYLMVQVRNAKHPNHSLTELTQYFESPRNRYTNLQRQDSQDMKSDTGGAKNDS
jgi:hypothetical protein